MARTYKTLQDAWLYSNRLATAFVLKRALEGQYELEAISLSCNKDATTAAYRRQ